MGRPGMGWMGASLNWRVLAIQGSEGDRQLLSPRQVGSVIRR